MVEVTGQDWFCSPLRRNWMHRPCDSRFQRSVTVVSKTANISENLSMTQCLANRSKSSCGREFVSLDINGDQGRVIVFLADPGMQKSPQRRTRHSWHNTFSESKFCTNLAVCRIISSGMCMTFGRVTRWPSNTTIFLLSAHEQTEKGRCRLTKRHRKPFTCSSSREEMLTGASSSSRRSTIWNAFSHCDAIFVK